MSNMNENDVSFLVTAVSNWCQTRPVKLCVLFGSQATGKARPDSDVDLAIWPDIPLDSGTKLRWLVELQNLLDKEVNLAVVSPDLDPVLSAEIVRDGHPIFTVDPEQWPKARTHLWHAYNDSLPFRRNARKQLRQFAEEVRRES
ncbi:MAG: nucleotidyltransferase family protein [Anaerolineae bacterium]